MSGAIKEESMVKLEPCLSKRKSTVDQNNLALVKNINIISMVGASSIEVSLENIIKVSSKVNQWFKDCKKQNCFPETLLWPGSDPLGIACLQDFIERGCHFIDESQRLEVLGQLSGLGIKVKTSGKKVTKPKSSKKKLKPLEDKLSPEELPLMMNGTAVNAHPLTGDVPLRNLPSLPTPTPTPTPPSPSLLSYNPIASTPINNILSKSFHNGGHREAYGFHQYNNSPSFSVLPHAGSSPHNQENSSFNRKYTPRQLITRYDFPIDLCVRTLLPQLPSSAQSAAHPSFIPNYDEPMPDPLDLSVRKTPILKEAEEFIHHKVSDICSKLSSVTSSKMNNGSVKDSVPSKSTKSRKRLKLSSPQTPSPTISAPQDYPEQNGFKDLTKENPLIPKLENQAELPPLTPKQEPLQIIDPKDCLDLQRDLIEASDPEEFITRLCNSSVWGEESPKNGDTLQAVNGEWKENSQQSLARIPNPKSKLQLKPKKRESVHKSPVTSPRSHRLHSPMDFPTADDTYYILVKNRYKCKLCKASFKESETCEDHIWVDHLLNFFECTICSLKFRSRMDLNLHTATCISPKDCQN